MSSGARRRLLLAALGVALIAALVLWRGGDGERADPPAPAATRAAPAPAPPPPGTPGAAPSLAPHADRLRQALDDYRRAAVYPPGSRPHDEGTAYKLAWNQPVVSDLPFLEQDGRARMFRFGADRAHVMFGEALTSWIEVFEPGEPERRVPARVVQAWVMSNASDGQGRKVALAYDDADGDLRLENRFTPSEHEELAAAQQVRILAEVEAEGERRTITRDFTYAPRPVLEILAVGDAVRDGSLVVTLDVEVHQAGLHTIEANLISGDGEVPIGYVDTSAPLAAGRGAVELVFFGRMLREARLDGPYQVRDLRGFLRDLDGGENEHWSDGRVHRTGPYGHQAFSDAEWDAPEKREKIQRFEQLIQESNR